MKLAYKAAIGVAALAVLFGLPTITGAHGYYTYLGYLIFLMVILTVAWDFAGGLARLLSLGSAAFFGVGAYAAAIAVRGGLPLPLALVIAGGVSAGTALILSISIKLRGIYFIISTLFLAQIMQIIMLNWYAVTGGNVGFYLPVPQNFTFLPFYYATLITALVAIGAYYVLQRSWIGLALRAIGNDEDAARSLGINPVIYKVLALVFSAFFMGIAGGIYANITLYLTTGTTFSLLWSIYPTFAAIIGGMGTPWGAVVGGTIIALLSQELTPIGPIAVVIESVILVAVILLLPAGVFGTILNRYNRRRVPALKPRVGADVTSGPQSSPAQPTRIRSSLKASLGKMLRGRGSRETSPVS
jgi:branched-chain amino acid transport system permease protein